MYATSFTFCNHSGKKTITRGDAADSSSRAKFLCSPLLRIVPKKIPWQKSDGLEREAWELANAVCKLKESLDEKQSKIHLTPGSVVSSCATINSSQGKRVCLEFRGLHAHAGQREVFRNLAQVITANMDVQNERGSDGVYVKDLDLFVPVQLFEDTMPVLSLGQLCEGYGCSCEWTKSQKPYLMRKDGRKIPCNTEHHVIPVRHSRELCLHHRTRRENILRGDQQKKSVKDRFGGRCQEKM